MGQKMYNVTIQGITKQYPEKIPYSEIVKEYEGSTDAPVMLVIVNGRLRELHKHLKADCEIEFVTSKDPIGHKTYCRSASLILLKAIYDVAGQENIDSSDPLFCRQRLLFYNERTYGAGSGIY